ncbi:hypothetical protein NEOLEDRAFT_1129345 [Neolentinus lepideus HHB14362 ss-1]|uniref:RlpA-like protein double-psi beta-barrel domain-containing protein n=1 Tax=Neolentinus lepideus HHB14362 ss-1 TaxID=1314782 RepID=A0A165UQ74_9AGAM|nr:hypothetical protein NEOLEDRAFT_1129345 [Neolentinus lepideus HHB14362 ss-1]
MSKPLNGDYLPHLDLHSWAAVTRWIWGCDRDFCHRNAEMWLDRVQLFSFPHPPLPHSRLVALYIVFPLSYTLLQVNSLVRLPKTLPVPPMRRCVAFSSIFALSLSFFGLVSADSSHAQVNRKHHARRDLAARETHQLGKRFDNARFTYFKDGLGACGQYSGPSDFIVAINVPQYDGGSHCFETITITANGKTTQAQVVDECEACPYGALDFSEGLFQYFSSLDQGTIYGTWEFGSGDPTTSSTPIPTPTTTSWSSTSTWSPPPTTSSKPPKTTSTSTWSPPTSTSTSTKSTHTSTSTTSTSTTSTSSAAPSTTSSAADTLPTASESNPDNLAQFNIALVNLAGLVMAAATATS